MIILRQKNCSTAGRVWAGTKGAIKGAASGAKWGAILALAALLGKYRLAAKIALAGATIGAGIGGYLGYNKEVDDYKLKEKLKEKLKTPEGREEIRNAEIQRIKSDAEEALIKAEAVGKYNPKDWITRYKRWSDKNGIIIPESVYKYITLYHDFVRTYAKPFYQDLIRNPQNYVDDDFQGVSQYFVLEFTDLFFAPVDPSYLNDFDDPIFSIVQISTSENPDVCICYNYKENQFEYEGGEKFETLSDAALDWVTYFEKNVDLSNKQLDIIKKFKSLVINKL